MKNNGKNDINTASEEELTRTAQISKERARHLIEKRPFKTWDDVKKVPGFEEGMVENLQQAGFIIK